MTACRICKEPNPRKGHDLCRPCANRYPVRFIGTPCEVCGVVGTAESPLRRSSVARRTAGRHEGCSGAHVKPEAIISLDVPFALDPVARQFIGEHPWGATRDEIAEAAGVSRELVRRTEYEALRRLRENFPGLAVDLAESVDREAEAAE